MEELYVKIEKYLQQQMETAELTAFEKEMQDDPELAAKVELYRETMQNVSGKIVFEKNKASWENTLDQLASKHFKDQPEKEAKRISIFKNKWSAVAAVAAAIALLLLVWQPFKSDLYREYAHHPSAALSVMSSSTANLAEIEKAFDSQDYKKAQPLLETYIAGNPQNSQAVLLKGICHLELEEFDSARLAFSSLTEKNSAEFRDYGNWYLALTALKEGQVDACKDQLRKILEDTDAQFYQEAERLLLDLEGG